MDKTKKIEFLNIIYDSIEENQHFIQDKGKIIHPYVDRYGDNDDKTVINKKSISYKFILSSKVPTSKFSYNVSIYKFRRYLSHSYITTIDVYESGSRRPSDRYTFIGYKDDTNILQKKIFDLCYKYYSKKLYDDKNSKINFVIDDIKKFVPQSKRRDGKLDKLLS